MALAPDNAGRGQRPRGRLYLRAFFRDLRLAFGSLVGRSPSDHAVLNVLADRPDLAQRFGERQTDMPQAIVADDTVTRRQHAPWREHFSGRLHGRGLEIGALHRPLPTHPGMTMTYLDRADLEALRRASPELDAPMASVQIVDDAEELKTVGDASFDFVVAAHVIEHMRNPIGALKHWVRAVVPGGFVYLIVPDKRQTFDRPRVRTLLEHLILDYQEPSAARDFEHYLEYAVHVQHSYGVWAVDEARRLLAEDYSLHYHTFLPRDMVALVKWMDDNVTPVAIADGPVMSPGADEFHLLLQRRESAYLAAKQ